MSFLAAHEFFRLIVAILCDVTAAVRLRGQQDTTAVSVPPPGQETIQREAPSSGKNSYPLNLYAKKTHQTATGVSMTHRIDQLCCFPLF